MSPPYSQFQYPNEIINNTTHASYITCWTIHNILLGIYPNPLMKDGPCLLFSWIWEVVNYFVRLKVKVPMRFQVIVININLIYRLCRFWFWFIIVMLCLKSLLTARKMKTSPILFFFQDLGFLTELQITLHCIFTCLSMHMPLPL